MLKGERVMVYRDSLREFSNSVYHMAGSGLRGLWSPDVQILFHLDQSCNIFLQILLLSSQHQMVYLIKGTK